jgi:hypothetical protein
MTTTTTTRYLWGAQCFNETGEHVIEEIEYETLTDVIIKFQSENRLSEADIYLVRKDHDDDLYNERAYIICNALPTAFSDGGLIPQEFYAELERNQIHLNWGGGLTPNNNN